MNWLKAAPALLLATVASVSSSMAQDSHYWTLQYGPRSSLLGGVVIGTVEGVSATYYNPGALARAKDLSFAVSTNVYEVSGVLLEDGGGEGVDLGRQTSGLKPSMVAGTIADSLFNGRGVLGYSAMNRVKGTQDFQGIIGLEDEELDPELGLRDLFGVIRFEGEFADFWGGLTYAHRLGENFGVGVTGYLASRSQRRRRETLGELISTDGRGAIEIDIAGGSYGTVRTLAKIGAYGRLGDASLGLTLTTPSLHVSGSGELGLNMATFLPDTLGLAYTIQTDLPAEYKTPLSVGAGIGLPLGPIKIHASAEWYDKIDPYVVIQGQTINAKEPEELEIPIDAVHELAEVLNWGVAVEGRISRRFNGYLTYFQDNSALNSDVERASLAIMPFDIQTVSIGTDFQVGPALLTLGFAYGWGRRVDDELTNVIDPEGQEGLEATFVFRSMRALFGFQVGV